MISKNLHYFYAHAILVLYWFCFFRDTLAKRTKKDLDPYLIYDIDGQEIGDENNG